VNSYKQFSDEPLSVKLMRSPFRFPGLIALLASLVLLSGPVLGQGIIAVTNITHFPGGVVTLTVQNKASFPPSGYATAFVLQGSTNLAPGAWKTVAATFSAPTGPVGFQTVTTTTTNLLDGQSKCFYRVIGILGTADDLDGDGLSNAFETNVTGTDPNLYDSDFDGFSDGQEYGYGTNPNIATSKPVFVTGIPTARFLLADSTATEGTSPHLVQVVFDQAFTGTLNYAINPLSSTVAGTDYTLGGSPGATNGALAVSGTSAFIPITLVDDTNTSGQRSIVLDLKLNGEAYFVGGRSSHVILLNDNDAWWTGTLAPASGEAANRSFRMKIIHQNATVSAVFGAGAGQDGLPIPEVTAGGGAPAIATTSLSASLVPVGTWPATGVADGATRFHAESPVFTIPAAVGSLLSQPLRRQLILDSQPALTTTNSPHQMVPGIRYIGTYTETLTAASGTPIAILPGSFILMRDLPASLPPRSTLVP
jgi:hypothetical protein